MIQMEWYTLAITLMGALAAGLLISGFAKRLALKEANTLRTIAQREADRYKAAYEHALDQAKNKAKGAIDKA